MEGNVFCPLCNLNLTKFTETMRNNHANRCIENGHYAASLQNDRNDVASANSDSMSNGSGSSVVQENHNTKNATNENKRTAPSEYDIMYIEDKDLDFFSPVQKRPHAKRPKVKAAQGTLSVAKNGNLSVQKPKVETAYDVVASVKVKPISRNLDNEISGLRETLGNIDEKIAELEKLKEITRKDLARKLKLKATHAAKTTVLDGCERRPLEAVLGVVFPSNYINICKNESGNVCDYNDIDMDVNNDMIQKDTAACSFSHQMDAPLWELSKLSPTFDHVVAELEVGSRYPSIFSQ